MRLESSVASIVDSARQYCSAQIDLSTFEARVRAEISRAACKAKTTALQALEVGDVDPQYDGFEKFIEASLTIRADDLPGVPTVRQKMVEWIRKTDEDVVPKDDRVLPILPFQTPFMIPTSFQSQFISRVMALDKPKLQAGDSTLFWIDLDSGFPGQVKSAQVSSRSLLAKIADVAALVSETTGWSEAESTSFIISGYVPSYKALEFGIEQPKSGPNGNVKLILKVDPRLPISTTTRTLKILRSYLNVERGKMPSQASMRAVITYAEAISSGGATKNPVEVLRLVEEPSARPEHVFQTIDAALDKVVITQRFFEPAEDLGPKIKEGMDRRIKYFSDLLREKGQDLKDLQTLNYSNLVPSVDFAWVGEVYVQIGSKIMGLKKLAEEGQEAEFNLTCRDLADLLFLPPFQDPWTNREEILNIAESIQKPYEMAEQTMSEIHEMLGLRFGTLASD